MLFVDNNGITDPRRNLAFEEYLLRHVDRPEPLLLFYVNEPSVIIGRNQNTIEEIDPDYVNSHNIHVVRRLSGGGAVYHDLGNLNFSFVTNGKEDIHNFAKFTEPVVAVLRSLGVAAELRGRSDIFAEGRKISGNAQYATAARMFSHGTLLFDTDLGEMLRAINPRRAQIESKAVHSVRSVVANIRELLPRDMTIGDLKAALIGGIFGRSTPPALELTADDWGRIEAIAAARYDLWQWNYGRSPQFNVQKNARFPAGKIDARIDVDEGRIRAIRLFGDFSGRQDVAGLEAHLVGVPYDRPRLTAALADVDLDAYFGRMDAATFIDLLY
ncbi:Lipoate-protein ligase LplJ [Candidatus Promineifilum breve]|uniref:lipoate--protein ligase n=1 Tax=Candidatus Promineifilum breve TaxID=1806508 RepID=A0A160SZ08_9CHLR|nr:lipoate--protein ligase [Candidatus Promineifilum breve]CUS02771.2 Lipoate-protein ligase LplJ [Candidatus Promineifilum breve]